MCITHVAANCSGESTPSHRVGSPVTAKGSSGSDLTHQAAVEGSFVIRTFPMTFTILTEVSCVAARHMASVLVADRAPRLHSAQPLATDLPRPGTIALIRVDDRADCFGDGGGAQ